MKILYLHGIGSGANARTARMIQEAFPECKVKEKTTYENYIQFRSYSLFITRSYY